MKVNRPDFFNLSKFEHSSWGNVQEFTIDGATALSNIADNSLHGLTGLKVLRIHYNLGSLESGVFLDSPNIEVLDLSDNVHLRIEYVSRALRYGLLKLKILDITGLQSFITEPFVLGREFTESVMNKPLKVLNVSQTKLVSFDNNFTYSSLQVLNASQTSLMWIPRHPRKGFFCNVTELDISYVSIPHPVLFAKNLSRIIHYHVNCEEVIFVSLRRIHAHHMNLGLSVRITDLEYNISCGSFAAEEVDISSSDIRWLNLYLNVKFLNLKVFKASRNSMEYISPKLIRSMHSLLELRLDHNRLMNMSSIPEFENILASSESLEIIDLSYNGLDTLPKSFFAGTPRLKEIHLQGNCIVHFGVDVGGLYRLRLLDLSDNSLLYIDANIMEDLKAINLRSQETAKSKSLSGKSIPGNSSYEWHQIHTVSIPIYEEKSTFVVNLQGNNFDCSCEHVFFLIWIEESNISFESKYDYKCRNGFYIGELYEENLPDLITYCKVNNQLPFIILGVILSLLLTISLVITGVCLHRKFKLRTIRKEYVNNYKRCYRHDQHPKKYPVFLSFCGIDDNIAKDYFHPKLVNGLAKYFGKNDVVCLGEKDARPVGFFTVVTDSLDCLYPIMDC
ncbi:hypothetical protein CHS0354_001085 [Potamilus streckersoni]|uniref:Toll-like receptor n=1 Tax=Potamilus streckersoni TaxID=2493646 RepID=A0AAE0VJS4_9BIVA|nr:hypothetical protein CHS0354_001085 [Potamilus streckersoni]